GAIFFIVVAAYLILKQFDLIPTLGISDTMSYGFVFAIGLVAAMSTCLAVTGGLLLAVAAKYNERFPSLAGVQKLKPHFYFNMGRIISYTILGGAVGALGSVLTFSPKATGFMTIAVSIVMVILGFQLLHLFPWMRKFQPKMPKFLAHKIHDVSGKDNKSAPFLLGASTFFLPCGFTQALQLYVLAKGDPITGALTMLAFSLGTLPALMSLSAISSFAKGAFQKYFLKFAGVAVVMLGFFNINNGIALTGSNLSLASVLRANGDDAVELSAEIVDGKQIIDMRVVGLDYSPNRFTVAQGIPVEWRIDGSQAEGCAQVVSVPKLGIVKYLSPSAPTVITFTPKE
ncbi:MAG: sulfite exporter TauE/SafE family protein, partial [Patescibacteria group bacterium]